jgi:hypothetical protein
MIYFINVYPFADNDSQREIICNTFVELIQHRTILDADYGGLLNLCGKVCTFLNETLKNSQKICVHFFDKTNLGICELPYIEGNQLLCRIRLIETHCYL